MQIYGMDRRTVTLTMPNDLWKKFKKKCFDNNLTYSYKIEELIRKDMGL